MSTATRHMQSDYMQFAKLRSGARYNLASSGVADCSLADLPFDPAALSLHGDNAYGYRPLTGRIAARFGIDPACVVTAAGCSFANHLAMAALVAPGDEVLVEDPTYELLIATLRYLGASIVRFARRPEQGWQLDPEAVAAALSPRTRLVVVTNLHNPTSTWTEDAAMRAVARAAAACGAHLLIDEVYRELLFRDGTAQTAFGLEPNILVTSSLTKAYGLSGLRCGWILAPEALADRMRRLNDLFGVLPPHVAECMSVAAFDALPALRARANQLLDANRDACRALLGRHPAVAGALAQQGTTLFPLLPAGDGDAFFTRLTQDYKTSIVPGRFFGCPDRIRIGLGGDADMTRAGLTCLAAALGA